jgi:hypothetical protein
MAYNVADKLRAAKRTVSFIGGLCRTSAQRGFLEFALIQSAAAAQERSASRCDDREKC